MGKFITQKNMAHIKHDIAVHNSRVKRGEISQSNTTDVVVWSCGCCASVYDKE
jgi:hypothetical protein